jgi:phosphoglycerol transferase
VQPPVLLEYDKQWDLKSVYLENTSKQFDLADPDNTLAYVDRCTAFEDGSADGDWCAMLVNRDKGIKLYRDDQLREGFAVDAPLDPFNGPRPSIRQAHMITQKGRRTRAGQYMLDHEVDDLEIRAWLNHAEKLAVDNFALIPSRRGNPG